MSLRNRDLEHKLGSGQYACPVRSPSVSLWRLTGLLFPCLSLRSSALGWVVSVPWLRAGQEEELGECLWC